MKIPRSLREFQGQRKSPESRRRGLHLLSLITIAVLMGLVATACGSSSTGGSSGSGGSSATSSSQFVKRGNIIGYSVYDLRQPYWQTFGAGIKAAAQQAGYQVAVSDEKSSEQEEVSGSQNLINENISALIVSPVQPATLPAVVNAAHAVHIPIVIGDVGAAGNYDAFVLSDNTGGGKLAAQYITNKLGSASGTKEVGVIELHPGSAVGASRTDGFVREMQQHPGFTIVGRLSGNDTVDGGFTVTQDLLSAHPHLAAIYAANDPEAEGAVQALKQAGRLGGPNGVMVVGFNGDPPALTLIKQGEMAATIAQDPYQMGVKCVNIALDLLNGKKVDFTDPSKRVYNVPVTLVNSSNVSQYINKSH